MITTRTTYVLRPMTVADIPQVTAIERASFPTAWPQAAYKREIEQNSLARYIVAVECEAPPPGPDPASLPSRSWVWRLKRRFFQEPALPPPVESRIVGFLGLWYMVDEGHIVTVASHPDLRRRGIGEMLVAEALDLARERGTGTVTLECRISNTGAQALYEKYGFIRAGIRKRYYTDNGEDAVIMTTPALNDPAYVEHVERLRGRRLGGAD
jgi:[ribosomal protein S18]-alanine N-acetyltransferase